MADEKNVNTGTENLETPDTSRQNPTGPEEQDNAPTIEELMTELAKERAEKVKLKNSLDSASSEAANYKKKLREKMTAEEQEAEEKQKAAEAQQNYIKELEMYKAKSEAKARYALQGMSEELAKEAAEAEASGDYEALSTIQKKHMDAVLAAKQKEWLASRPDPNTGNGEDSGQEKDPFLDGFKNAFK